MPTNDVILVAEMVERSRAETVGMSAAEQEAYFFAKHYLRARQRTTTYLQDLSTARTTAAWTASTSL